MRKIAILGLAGLAALTLACSSGASGGTTHGPGVTSSDPGDNDSGSTKSGGTGQSEPSGHTIVFAVTGRGVSKATSISYGVGGNTSQANGARLPWTKQTTSNDAFLLLSLVAQSGSGGSGSISCKITVDGKVVVDNTSEGQYAVVTCTGNA